MRRARCKMGVSLNRKEGTGLGEARGLEKGEGEKGGGGVLLREVELFRLVLRFSIGMGVDEGRRPVVGLEDSGRGEEAWGRFSGITGVLEEAEPGLLGAGFRFGLCRELVAVVGDARLVGGLCSPTFSRSPPPVGGLLATQVWLRTDVAVELSGREHSDD